VEGTQSKAQGFFYIFTPTTKVAVWPIATNFTSATDASLWGEAEVGRAAEFAALVENDPKVDGPLTDGESEGDEWYMSQDAEISPVPPAAPAARSPAAERMRAHRERRRIGLRCVTVHLREKEIDVLIRKGLLKADARNDLYAVRDALHAHFDRTLGAAK
jgi:hypothetical protein